RCPDGASSVWPWRRFRQSTYGTEPTENSNRRQRGSVCEVSVDKKCFPGAVRKGKQKHRSSGSPSVVDNMGSYVRRFLWIRQLIVLSVLSTLLGQIEATERKGTTTKNDECEYEIDLTRNTVKAVCHGQSMGVNVYADTASVVTSKVEQIQGNFSPGQGTYDDSGLQPESDSRMPGALLNITSLLKGIRQNFGSQTAAMTNISSMLRRGDGDLKHDLERLRRLVSSPSSFGDGIIATLQNQYNFMRTAILAQNAELTKVLNLLDLLAEVTTESVQTSTRLYRQLEKQLAFVNGTMLTMRKMFSSELKKCSKRCASGVSAFGRGEAMDVQWVNGVVMHDATNTKQRDRIWIMTVGPSSDQLLQYDSDIDVQYQLVSRQYSLPFFCEGTGHVVHRHALYCQKSGTRVMAKYNLRRMEIASEMELPSVGIGNTYPYQFGLNSDIDFAVDELGLWVVYSTEDAAGKMVISKLNPRTLNVEKTWMTSYPKNLVGNSFMICGILYATDSFEKTPTFIRYVYDTNSQREYMLEPGQLVFQNAAVYNASSTAKSVMLDYDSGTQKLYSWSNSQIQSFPVFFKSASP
ncbi:hypothetical protein BaRGS_00009648, partial [Batillaria attramentaria]